ncbi:MAG: ATP-binding protein [Planctomycetota bacterium]
MRFDTLSSRIFAALAGILVLLLVSAAIFGEIRLRDFHRVEIEARLRTAAGLLAEEAGDKLVSGSERSAFAERLAEVGRLTGLRLTVIAPDGTVHADSEARSTLANHASRPEIVRAQAEGEGLDWRSSATTQRETYYFARRIDRGGQTIGYVRAAAELEKMERAIGELRRSLLLGGLVALLLGLLVSAVLARWISRPLETMGASAMNVTNGHLDARIRGDGPVEVRLLAGALNSMADKLRQQIRGERSARAEIETILASMAEGVVAVDARARVLLMNATAARMLGLVEPVGTGEALWQHVRFPELERALASALESGQPWHADATPPGNSANSGRVVALSVAPIQGEVPGAVALLSDVTEVRRLEQVRIDFVANVSHEMRTPLSAVMGALETISDPEQDSQTRKRFLEIASRNTVRLRAIVGDLLDLSSIEAQGEKMHLEPIAIHEPLRGAAAALQGTAQKKGLELTLPVATPAARIQGNRQRLEQAFTNLFANAIHYTPPGGRISARIRVAPKEIAVDVEDTGIGIPAHALPRVFERFYRVDPGRSRDTGGTGLGLAIVKHIVRAHGGEVFVASQEGRGTTFTVKLPRPPATLSPGIEEAPRPSEAKVD